MSGFVRYSSNVFLRFDLPQIGLKWEFFGQSETRKGRIRNNLRFRGLYTLPPTNNRKSGNLAAAAGGSENSVFLACQGFELRRQPIGR